MTPTSHLKRSRSNRRVHRGDVESSADSQEEEEEPITPKRRVLAYTAVTEKKPAVSINRARMLASRSIDSGLATMIVQPESSTSSSSSDKVVVCVRIKPTSSPFASSAYDLSQSSLTLSTSHPSVVKRGGKAGRESEYTYDFDALLQFPSRTPDLYEAKIAPLVQKAMNGFNSTIFAYGQTGSGKSFTMTGTESELGIIPCAVDGVFDAINAEPSRAYLLRVSYIEIYNETLRDLLAPDEKPVIHTAKGKTYVDPLTEQIVSTPQDVVDVLTRGNAGRKVGATDWNDRSSRSHCVFTIIIESRPQNGAGDIRLSRLNLIDLAGSEKAVSDVDRRGEGKHINQSLLALREVVHKLTEKKKSHIPYRNSKLTHLLENALGGDSNICVICTLSAEEEHCAETLETLKFAGRCSQVETKARKHILPSSERAVIRAKDEEIEQLKQQLQILSQNEPLADLAESVASMEARKHKLTDQLAKLNGEILTSDVATNRPKRRRISDFRGVGLGQPKPLSDRRAFSSMIRVVEEAVPAENDSFREMAANKARDAELMKALSKIESYEAKLREQHSQFESTRNELVNVIQEKDGKIDKLESLVLDLRSSREEVMIEGEGRVEGYKSQLETALREAEQGKGLREEMERLKATFKAEVEEFEQGYEELQSQHTALQSQMGTLQSQHTSLETSHAAVKTQHASLQTLHNSTSAAHVALQTDHLTLQEEHTTLRSESKLLQDSLANLQDSLANLQDQLRQTNNSHATLFETSEREKQNLVREREVALKSLDDYQKAAISAESQTVADLKAELASVRRAKDEEAAKAGETEKIYKSQIDSLLAEKEGWERTSAEVAAKDLRSSTLENTIVTLTTEVETLNHQVEETKRLHAESNKHLEESKRGHGMSSQQLNAQIDDLTKGNEDLNRQLSDGVNEIERLQRRIEAVNSDSTSKLSTLAMEREELEKSLSLAKQESKAEIDGLHEVIAGLKRQLSEGETTIETLKLQLQGSSSASTSQIESLTRQLDEATKSSTQFEKLIAEITKSKIDLEHQLSVGIAENEKLRKDLTIVTSKCDQFASELESLANQLETKTASDAKRELAEGEARKALANSQEVVSRLEKRASTATASLDRLTKIHAESVRELEKSTASFEASQTALKSKTVVTEEQAVKIQLLVSQLEGRQGQDALAAERHNALEASLGIAATELESSRSRIASLEKSLSQSETSRTASESLISTLKAAAATQASIPNDKDEIERLEKLVSDQQTALEDQKEKIAHWKRELEKYGQVVKELTDNCTCGSNSPETSTSSTRNQSMKTSRTKNGISSTFTARNLALPSYPTPLPLHPSQFSNVRAKRRVTIEHDMDRLTDSNKVAKTKAVFDSPDPSPTKISRSGSARSITPR